MVILKQTTPIDLIIVPEGLAADKWGNTLNVPSFIYKSVLDYSVSLPYENKRFFLAPANNFQGELFEQESALKYLKDKLSCEIHCPVYAKNFYINTSGNAKYLMEYINNKNIKLNNCELIAYHMHFPRAKLSFERYGFHFKKFHRVFNTHKKNHIVKRLWYYKYPKVHYLYEIIAHIISKLKII
ncbi:MAG: hypothetical protein OXB84_01340 [Halobacteriovoraceae bacterium]|nr:hypothetical protein [Halobacteriovoraceae bacterium]